MDRVLRYSVKITLAVLVLFGVLLETFLIPVTAAELEQVEPAMRGAAVPLTLWATAIVLCGQAILLIAWRLTTLTADDAIFDRRAFGLMRGMIALAAVGTALLLAAFVGLNIIRITPAFAMVALIGGIAVGVAVCLILTTLLGLLRRAATFATEMAQVV